MGSHGNSYAHLQPQVQELMQKSNAERRMYLRGDIFVDYETARLIHAELEQAFSDPDKLRPNSLLLLGESDSGKSTIFEQFCSRHPASDNEDGLHAKIPVVRSQFPEADGLKVWHELSGDLNIVLPDTAPTNRHKTRVVKKLRDVGAKVIILDEVANLTFSTETRQATAFKAVKYLINAFKRPLVIALTPEIWDIFKTDEHVRTRFKVLPIVRLENDEEFAELLDNWEAVLPLKKPSKLSGAKLRARIYEISGGLMGNIEEVLKSAAGAAIGEEEQITLGVLKMIGFVTSNDVDTLIRKKMRGHKGKS
jgi:hypothetical protein